LIGWFMATLRWDGILDPSHLSTKFGQYESLRK
jgi:hypothetical protein